MNLLKSALAYFEQHQPVIAVRDNKSPYRTGWNEYFSRQQTEDEVRQQFSNGAWGVARVLYPACDYIHLDFDGKHGKKAWLKTGIILPKTARIRTKSGGHHLVFKSSELLRNTALKRAVRIVEADCDCKKSCGVDFLIRGVAVVPPSPGYHEVVSLELAVPIPDDVVRLAMAKREQKKDPKFGGKIPQGKRNVTLLSIGGVYRHQGAEYGELVEKLWKENRSRCQPPLERSAVEKIAGSLCKYEPAKKSKQSHDDKKEVEFVSIDTIQPEKVDWLWSDRIPLGYLTAIQGDSGVGKSYLSLEIAASVSSGRMLPGNKRQLSPSHVLLLAFEDAPGDILRPRLDLLNADNSGIIIPDPKRRLAPNLMSVELIETAVKEVGPALLIVDPIVAFGGRRNNDKDSEVREFLSPLMLLVQRSCLACIMVRHLNKQSGPKALYRGSGSGDYAAAFREIFTVAEDPRQEGRRVFAHTKNNISGLQPSLSFYIDENGFRWGEEVDMTADELVAPESSRNRGRRRLDTATRFLEESLSDGPTASEEIFKKAKTAGISRDSVWEAKKNLGVRAKKEGLLGGWQWELPVRSIRIEGENDE